MMDLKTIRERNAEVAKKAKNAQLKPVLVTQEQIDAFKATGRPGFKIPFIGDYRPRGFTLGRVLFVDTSGMGSPGEPALTQTQLAGELVTGMAYALIEVGQFQGYVGEFTPPAKKVRK